MFDFMPKYSPPIVSPFFLGYSMESQSLLGLSGSYACLEMLLVKLGDISTQYLFSKPNSRHCFHNLVHTVSISQCIQYGIPVYQLKLQTVSTFKCIQYQLKLQTDSTIQLIQYQLKTPDGFHSYSKCIQYIISSNSRHNVHKFRCHITVAHQVNNSSEI